LADVKDTEFNPLIRSLSGVLKNTQGHDQAIPAVFLDKLESETLKSDTGNEVLYKLSTMNEIPASVLSRLEALKAKPGFEQKYVNITPALSTLKRMLSQ
jgi:hypothetical protein